MYTCNLKVNLIGNQCKEFRQFKELKPVSNFNFEFIENTNVRTDILKDMNVLIVNMNFLDVDDTLEKIIKNKNDKAEIIVIIDNGKTNILNKYMNELSDIITPEISEFKIKKWFDRYKLDKDLWETGQYLDAVINSAPNMVWFKTKDGRHEKVNATFCDVVGKTMDQVKNQRHAYIWDVPEDDPACIESENMVTSSRQTITSNEIVKTKDEEKELRVYKSPLYDWDGSVMGTVGVGIEITQEQLYKKDSLNKSDTIEKIFTTLNCGVIRHSLDGKRVFGINKAALDILGYENKNDLIFSGFNMIAASVIEEDKPKLNRAISSLKREGDSVSLEYRVRHRDGKLIYVIGDIKLLRDNDEYIYQRFLLDYTFQKLQEDKMERQYDEVIKALSMGYDLVCFFDNDKGLGKIIQKGNDIEERYSDIFDGDILLESSMRHYIDKFVYRDDKQKLKEFFKMTKLKELLIKEKIHTMKYRVGIDEKVYYYKIETVFTETYNGDQGIILAFRCIDAEVKSEMEQRLILEDALKQAQNASKAKTTFLSNMSHDIRTPINAIVGFSSLALSHYEDREQTKGYLNKILTSSNQMLRLLNNVLDMSSIESGKMHLDENINNLGDIIDETITIIEVEIGNKNLKFSRDIDIKHTNIICDKLRLSQVLLNILSNSVKYTKDGEIKFSVHEDEVNSVDYVKYIFTIEDTGIGIGSEFLKRIFEPFEREKNTTLSGISGTGLGLAITKNIIEMMNGTVKVESTLGVGSKFIVELVLKLSDDEKDKFNSIENSENTLEKRDYRLLLVEDNELNQEIATELLEEQGYKVEVADNGQLAVKTLIEKGEGYYDLILMDIQMPLLNGYEATREIRSLENKNLANIPILAMTANAFEEDRKQALNCGMNEHIAKPINIEHVNKIIMSVLMNR